jgi:hypothetical protein
VSGILAKQLKFDEDFNERNIGKVRGNAVLLVSWATWPG